MANQIIKNSAIERIIEIEMYEKYKEKMTEEVHLHRPRKMMK